MRTSERIFRFATFLLLLGGLVLQAWASPAPAFAARPAASSTPTLEEMAAAVAEEVGVVQMVVEGEGESVIFVFDERHDSRLGQVEIAIMLNRLYADYGMRYIGLEGLAAEAGPLDLSWAHREPYYQPGQPITSREDVLTQMLQEGEFGSAEFLGLIYPDVVVEGIDNADLYAVNPAEGAWRAPYDYLYDISLASMSDEDYTAWDALIQQKRYQEAFEFAMSADPFVAERYEMLKDTALSVGDMLSLLDELEAQADEVGANLVEGAAENLKALRDYLGVVSERSTAMVENALALAEEHADAPLAITIGAMHTEEVSALLQEAGVSFAVISPLSLVEKSEAGLLSAEAYQRKEQGLSVAPDGWLGSFLDGRKKPPPVADKERVQVEERLRELLQAIAEHAFLDADLDELSGDEIKAELNELLADISEADNEDVRRYLPKGWQVSVLSVSVEREPRGSFDEEDVVTVLVTVQVQIPGHGTLEILLRNRDGTKKEAARSLPERLQHARRTLQEEKTPPPEGGEEGEKPRPQRVCSTTEVESVVKKSG